MIFYIIYSEGLDFFPIFDKNLIMVSERVGQYLEKKGISYYAFENSLGASRGSISKAVKEGKSIGSNVLETIMNTYPDINPNWLLTGQGEMFVENEDFLINRAVETFPLKTDNSVEKRMN